MKIVRNVVSMSLIVSFLYFVQGEQALLRFLILADWGKGGTTGAYGSVVRGGSIQEETSLSVGSFIESGATTNQLGDPSSSEVRALRAADGGGGGAQGGQRGGQGGDQGGQGQGQGGGQAGGGGAGGGGAGQGGQKSNQLAVAKAMDQFASNADPAPEFILALGDNFYDNGVQSSTDQLFDYVWKDVYIEPYASLNIPWYLSPGNHDYQGSVQAQIDRYHDHTNDDVWIMPATNFSEVFQITTDNDNVTVGMIFIDTPSLSPQSNSCCNENRGISKNEQARRITDQLARIQTYLQELTVNRPDWLIAVGHYPIYSAGDHCDNSELISYVLPLFQYYGVDVYISGHDHISEHLEYQNIVYYVAGAGAKIDYLNEKCTTKANLKWYGVGYGAFGYMDATKDSLTMNFIDTNNELKYSYTQSTRTKRPTKSPTASPTNRTSFPTPPPSLLPPPPPPQATPDDSSSDRSSSLQSSHVVYISFAGIALAGIAVFLFYRFYDRKKPTEVVGGSKKIPMQILPSPKDNQGKGRTSPPSDQQQQQRRIAKNYIKFTDQPDSFDAELADEEMDEEAGRVKGRKLNSGPAMSEVAYEKVGGSKMRGKLALSRDRRPSFSKKKSHYSPLEGEEERSMYYSPQSEPAYDSEGITSNHGGSIFNSVHTPGHQPIIHRRANTTAI